jgi:hypothetical protein
MLDFQLLRCYKEGELFLMGVLLQSDPFFEELKDWSELKLTILHKLPLIATSWAAELRKSTISTDLLA